MQKLTQKMQANFSAKCAETLYSCGFAGGGANYRLNFKCLKSKVIHNFYAKKSGVIHKNCAQNNLEFATQTNSQNKLIENNLTTKLYKILHKFIIQFSNLTKSRLFFILFKIKN